MKLESLHAGPGNDAERRVLAGMVVNTQVLARVSSLWGGEGLFSSRWANLVGSWCVSFYGDYKDAPGGVVQSLYSAWAEDAADPDTALLVESFLSSLSDDYSGEDVNPDYLIDVAGGHFNRVRLQKLADNIQGDLLRGDSDKAGSRVSSFKRVEVGVSSGIDVVGDREALKAAFSERAEPLIAIPGALGEFYGSDLARDCFVAFFGPQKRGKSWVLIDLAWRGLLDRRKVAFFALGDLTAPQMMRRFGCRAAAWPTRARTLKIPTSIRVEKNKALVETQERDYPHGLAWSTVDQAFSKIPQRIKSSESHLKLWTSPAGSTSASLVEETLDRWEGETGWVPDIVILDYADIMAPPGGVYYRERRDAVNDNWVALRALSAKKHCLVITATQANAQSYKASTLGMHHFSEDNRKNSHVTGMVGLSCRPSEKKDGVMRFNWTVRREDENDPRRCVFAAGNLAIGNPCIVSSW